MFLEILIQHPFKHILHSLEEIQLGMKVHLHVQNFWHFPERRTTTSSSEEDLEILTELEDKIFYSKYYNNTYTPQMRRPAAARDISRNTESFFWRDIQNQTHQLRCPITPETFQPDDMVSKYSLWSYFSPNALNTYLNDYDHRCPICRYNISNDIIAPPSFSSNNTNNTNTTTTPASAETPRSDN